MNSEDAKTGITERGIEGAGELGRSLFLFASSRLRCSLS
jgi:hypothetical protein